VGDGAARQSFVHVDDAASATVTALERGSGVYNVVDDEPAPARDWTPLFAAALGAPPPRRVPAWIVRLVAGADAPRTLTVQRGASNRRIREQLGWSPAHPDWREGLATPAGAEAEPPAGSLLG
jgi:nucleoside-diphosphate-sugar epimerase